MKKLSKLFFSLLAVLGLCFVVACKTGTEPCTEHQDSNNDGLCDNCGEQMPQKPKPTPEVKKSLSSLQLNTATVKKAYYLGEEFSKTNLMVLARFTNGTSEDVSAAAEVNIDAFDNQTVGTYPIIVSYEFEGRIRRNSYEVSVSSLADTIEKHIVGLEVEKKEVSLSINTELSLSDLKVTAVYSDESTKELTSEEYTVDQSLVDLTKPNVYPLVVKFSEEYNLDGASEEVIVKNFVLITVNDPVSTLSFVEGTVEFEYGSAFSTADWKILVTYESGATLTIDNTSFTNTTIDTFQPGDKTCRVYYTEMGIRKQVLVTVKVLPNPNADYHIDKRIDSGSLTVKPDVDITSNHKQALAADELDEFFSVKGELLKYLKSDNSSVTSVEIVPGNGITFTIEGTAKLSLVVTSNGSSNTSLLSVTNENDELQKQLTTVPETTLGLISIKGSGNTQTTVEFSLPAGTYTVAFVSGVDDSSNVATATTISATRAGRVVSLQVKA